MSEDRTIPTPAPSDLPTFTVLLDGEELSGEYNVISVVVIKAANRISYAKITLLDGDPAVEDFKASGADLFIPGKKVEIQAGYHSDESSIFKGLIVKHALRIRHGKPSLLVIECKHEAVKLSMGRKSAYYYESSDSDVFNTIIKKYTLDPDVEDSGVTHKELVQYCCSDWDFILSRAEANGMLVFTNDAAIKIAKPDASSDPVLSLIYGSTILDCDAEIDARTQVSGVSSRSWDISKQEVLSMDGEEPKTPKQGNLDGSTLADVVYTEEFDLSHAGRLSDEELQAWADAQFLKSRMSRIQGKISFIGYPEINPGDLLELKGLGNRMNGKAYVTGIRHVLGNGAWTTDAQLGMSSSWFMEDNDVNQPPASALLPAVSGLQIGVVSKLQDDPDGEDRIQVRMPLLGDDDGVWTRVATLDAGEKRGSFFRPEIGDEVLLGFLNDDPRNPVVLGMLNSSAKPAPITASDDNHVKGFVTRSEMKVLFDDEKSIITIETPNGNTIILSDDEGSITLEDENSNKLQMNSDGITIQSPGDINIKADGDVNIEGNNTSVKAGSQFKAEGSSGAEMSTGATAVVKGSLVQIN